MKRSELKKIMKPLIEECIRESILEGGIISNIITEVVKGVAIAPAVQKTAAPTSVPNIDPTSERMRKNTVRVAKPPPLREHKEKLMAAIGQDSFNGVNLFEGSAPIPNQLSPQQQAQPLSDHPFVDPGVDINNLFNGNVTRSWGAHMNNLGEGK